MFNIYDSPLIYFLAALVAVLFGIGLDVLFPMIDF